MGIAGGLPTTPGSIERNNNQQTYLVFFLIEGIASGLPTTPGSGKPHNNQQTYLVFFFIEGIAGGLPTTPGAQHSGIKAADEAKVPTDNEHLRLI